MHRFFESDSIFDIPSCLESRPCLSCTQYRRSSTLLTGLVGLHEMKNDYKPGDPVIFRVTKQSTDPGPRAVDVHPAQSGETYSYQVDKFWTVAEVANGQLQLVTRRGKQRSVPRDDLRLRHASWWERWIYGNRFPKLSQVSGLTTAEATTAD